MPFFLFQHFCVRKRNFFYHNFTNFCFVFITDQTWYQQVSSEVVHLASVSQIRFFLYGPISFPEFSTSQAGNMYLCCQIWQFKSMLRLIHYGTEVKIRFKFKKISRNYLSMRGHFPRNLLQWLQTIPLIAVLVTRQP